MISNNNKTIRLLKKNDPRKYRKIWKISKIVLRVHTLVFWHRPSRIKVTFVSGDAPQHWKWPRNDAIPFRESCDSDKRFSNFYKKLFAFNLNRVVIA